MARLRTITSWRAVGLALTLATLSAAPAAAAPVTLVVDPAQSSFDFYAGVFFLSGNDSGVFGGSLDLDLTLSPGGATFEALDAQISLSDVDIVVPDNPSYQGITVSTRGISASLVGGPVVGTEAPGGYAFDLLGFALTFDQGEVLATGAVGEFPLENADLSVTPALNLIGSTATVSLTDLGLGAYAVELVIPFVGHTRDFILPISPGTNGFPAEIDGQLVATGVLQVPEPSSLALLCAALAGIAGRARAVCGPTAGCVGTPARRGAYSGFSPQKMRTLPSGSRTSS